MTHTIWTKAETDALNARVKTLEAGLAALHAQNVKDVANIADLDHRVAILEGVAVPPPVDPPPVVIPPVGGAWPNAPTGLTLLSDTVFPTLRGNGWDAVQRQQTNGSGLFLVPDPTAPLGGNVLEFKYATGYTGGSEPGCAFFTPPSPVKETYFATWWKPSNPWQNHPGSNVNKLLFLFSSGAPIYLQMFGSPGTLQVVPEFSGDTRRLPPNRTATTVVLGAWHQVEWYVKYSTPGSRDGITRWWLDGVLQGEYTDLAMPSDAGFIEYQFAPTWGGIGGTKSETDFYRFNHARILQR